MGKTELKAESKRLIRKPCSKVVITWTDPYIDPSIQDDNNSQNRISYPMLIADLVTETPRKFLSTNRTYSNLDGTYYLAPSDITEARRNQFAWWGLTNSDSNGYYTTAQTIDITFSDRLVLGWLVFGDNKLNQYPVDFDVSVLVTINNTYYEVDTMQIRDNDSISLYQAFNTAHINATGVRLKIYKWSHGLSVVKISEFYTSFVKEYYDDDIVMLNVNEEFESSKGSLPIGNISINECELKLQNITDDFFPENTSSQIRNFIVRNRKIEPFIGFEYSNGVKEYFPKGLYWSGDWSMSDNGTDVSTTGRDRMELLRNLTFDNSILQPVFENMNLYNLAIIVMEQIKDLMPDFYYEIDSDLSSYTISICLSEFFKDKNFFEMLFLICQCSLSYAYMDTPTEVEKVTIGVEVKDVLRIKKYENIFNRDITDDSIEELTKKDYIDKMQPIDIDSMANYITIKYKEYVEDAEEETGYKGIEKTYTKSDQNSIRQYGQIEYEYEAGDLVQTEEQAEDIAYSLLSSFVTPKRDITVNGFGDVTLQLGEILKIPEYQKNSINNYGYFAIKKLSHNYNGALRGTIEARKLRIEQPTEYLILQHTDGSENIKQITDNSQIVYQSNGL